MALSPGSYSKGTRPEQFLRKHVRPRRHSRRILVSALRWIGAMAGLAGLVAAGFWTAAAAGSAPELAVSRIVVEGNDRLAEGEILQALGLDEGANILSLDLETLKDQLLRSTWVSDAELRRILPATLMLRIEERVPVGIAVLDELYLIDGEGVFLDAMGPGYAELTLPLVSGIADGVGGDGSQKRAELAGRILAALATETKLANAVSEVDVSAGAGSLRIHLRYPELTLLANERDVVTRLKEFLPLSEEIQQLFPALEIVDLRFQRRTYLRLGSVSEDAAPIAPEGAIGGR